MGRQLARAPGPAVLFQVSGRGSTRRAALTGTPQDYTDPVFTEDYQVLTTLNDYYGGQLLLVKSLFATAQAAGLVTATVGKSGAAYIQNLGKGGLFIDENTVQPRSLVAELQTAGFALPVNVVKGYSGTDAVTLTATNGRPTGRARYVTFDTTAYDPNGAPSVAARDATDSTQGAPENAANKYLLSVFTQYILPIKKPMLSLIWFRTPDNAQHPLRAIAASGSLPNGPVVNGATSGTTSASIAGVATTGGYSFSGDVRSADLWTYRGFKAYDGSGCSTSAMYGLSASGVPTAPVRLDASGALCGSANAKYQAISGSLPTPVASFQVAAPGSLPANSIIVAAPHGAVSRGAGQSVQASQFVHFDAVAMPLASLSAFAVRRTPMGANSSDLKPRMLSGVGTP